MQLCETNQSGETLLQSEGDQERLQGLGTAAQGVRSTSSALHPRLDAGGNTATAGEEKAEALNAFFPSVFIKVNQPHGHSALRRQQPTAFHPTAASPASWDLPRQSLGGNEASVALVGV